MQDQHPAIVETQDRIRAAIASRTPLRIRGGGSKEFLGHALQGEVLDTRTISGIVSYEPSELVVTVRAGTPLVELEAALAAQGQCLPFEPPHFSRCTGEATVGGMVAAGLAGPARASVGGVRDYVLGVQLINGKAELLTFGGQVMKNVAGYDVSRLMVGAMGTLGLLTEISLKVLPMAPAETTLVFAMDQHSALEQLHVWGGEPLPLNASRWQGNIDGTGSLHVRLRGAVAAVEAASRKMLQDAAGYHLEATLAAQDWEQLRNQTAPFFADADPASALWRVSVPQTAPALELAWPQCVEWHGGLRWIVAPAAAGPALQKAASAVGGVATVFVAARAQSTGDTGQNAIQLHGTSADAIAARLKSSFDPHGIFNRQRLCAAY